MWHVSLEMWVDTGTAFLNKLLPVSKDTPNNKAVNNESPVTNDRKQMHYERGNTFHNHSLLGRHT